MRPTVLLFDIDGTLIDAGGVGRRSMRAAFHKVTSRADACDHISFAGMTDRAIAREGLSAAGHDPTPAAIEMLLEVYLDCLDRELSGDEGFRVLPGVHELLAALGPVAKNEGLAKTDVAVGLGTGNVKRGAFAKLARGSIAAPFSFGGFGCDAEDRTELVRIGAMRGAAALGVAYEACRVVVIGDTPKDIAAARGIGAVAVGVATGSTPTATFHQLGADHAFETLEDPGVRRALLEGAD